MAQQPIARWLVQTPSTVITDGAGGERILLWTMAPTDFSDHMIHFSLKTDQIARAKTLELVLGDASFANAYRFPLRSGQGEQWIVDGEQTKLTLSWSGFITVGAPNRAQITHVKLRVADDAFVPVRIDVDGIGLVREPVERYPRGVLSFTFDDNFDTMITEGAARLDPYDFRATAYIIVSHVDKPGRASLAQLRERHMRGWDIAAHAFTDANHTRRWPELSPVELENDIVDSREWLMNNGFTGYDHCAYPGGEFTGTHAMVDRYFTSCRTIYQRQREGYLPAAANKLRVLYFTPSTTLAQATAAVDAAIVAREWLIVVFHKLVDQPSLSTEWSKTDFAAFVEHVRSTGIPVETVTRVLAE